ncbi:mechanosensitive ion channel [Akkermansiaceae bacterium]|nr:mechanosensitive ion channel [Akkermansiaceae bacterium]
MDVDGEIESLLPGLKAEKIAPEEARKLFTEHRKLLKSVEKDYSGFIAALESANEETKKTIKEIETYTLYLDERLLWIPSASPLAISDLKVELESLQRLLSPEEFPAWFQNLIDDMGNHPILWIFTFLLLLALVFLRKKFIARLREAGSLAERKSCQSILPTIKSLGLTFLLVLPFPLLVGFLAWRGHHPTEISRGLGECAKFLAIVGAAKTLSRPKGILTTHLGVNKATTAHLHKHLRWFFFAMPVFLFLLQALYETPKAPQSGRLVFLTLLIMGGIFIHCLLRPGKGVIASKKNRKQLPKVVYGLALTIIIAFIIGVSLGYISSVKTLRVQTLNSVGIILASLLVGKILLRYILVSRRRLARNQAVAKYKAVIAAREQDEEAENTKHIPSLEEIEAEAINVVAVQEQTTRLVRVGITVFVAVALWNIWSTSFPALSALDKINLWEGSGDIPAKTENPAANLTDTLTGKESSQAEPEEPTETTAANIISLQDLLYAFLVIGLTLIGARNLPGLLELSILGRLNLKPGGNYAITTVTKYLIIAVGFVMAFGVVGISWSSVQWLAAAVTLGIGFGLQEIFANFVAGIILLFERPIRLGDVVTVGEVSGRVSEIKIRATTIRQFNNRELVVPNKEFITGQLVNWTLSDNILRFEFQVGIAYGSDTEKATEILYDILDKHPDVLKSHPPVILFKAFGNSTLDFEIRAFVTKYERFPEVQSQLHYQIDKRFREAHIEIAFPQTDIHIRSMPEFVPEKKES